MQIESHHNGRITTDVVWKAGPNWIYSYIVYL